MNSRSESISAYCNYVNSKKEKLANAAIEDIIVTITFSKPLNQAEFESYVRAHDIRKASFEVRGIQPDGTRTSGWAPIEDSGTSGGKLQGVINEIGKHGEKFIGVVSIDGYIDSKNLLAAISDPNSYLVDTSRDAYWGGLFHPKGDSRNNWTKGLSPAEIFNRDLAWQLEDHGISGYSYYLTYQKNS